MYKFVILSALVAVCAGSALPLDTPEVAHAKAAHLAAVEQAKARNLGSVAWSAPAYAPAAAWAPAPAVWSAPAPAYYGGYQGAPAPVVVAHGQVQDTPEVAAEKSKHFALVAEAAARAAASPDYSGSAYSGNAYSGSAYSGNAYSGNAYSGYSDHSDDGQYRHDPSGDADYSAYAAPAGAWAAPAAQWTAGPAPIVVANGQVQDTPEVAAAKAAHLAKLRAAGGAHW